MTADDKGRDSSPAVVERLRGGGTTVAHFERLLGLDDVGPDFCVKIVVWLKDHFEVFVGPDPASMTAILVTRKDPENRTFIETEHLGVFYKGDSLPPEMEGPMLEKAPGRLAGRTIESLYEVMSDDPGSEVLPDPRVVKKDVADLLTSWAGQSAYSEFFAVGEMVRSQLDSVDLSGNFIFVQHCDNECLFVTPSSVAPIVSAVEYPWDSRTRSFDVDPDPAPAAGEPDMMMTSDLTEHDVIVGNPEKVADLMDHVVSRPNPKRKPIFFSNTCVPTVTGEDVESVVSRYKDASDVPIVYLTVSHSSMTNVFRELLVDRRLEREAAAGKPDPRAVNLVGFPNDQATRDLEGLLERFGVRVNCRLIPALNEDLVDRFPSASLNVMRPNVAWDHFYRQLGEETKIPSVSPQAPYGVNGTRRWLDEVLAGLGMETEGPGAWDGYFEPWRAAWDRAAQGAMGHRLGFVARAQELEQLTDPAMTWGVPILEMTEEAGFGLDVLIEFKNRKEAREKTAGVHRMFRSPDRHTILGFSGFDMMKKRLVESPCEAVLSFHFFDWRLSGAGKNRFSLQHFEMGVPGAVRTVRRLVGICETSFYRDYRKCFERSAEGIPVPGGDGSKR